MTGLVVAVDARPLSNPQAGGFRSYMRALLKGLNERVEAGEPIPRLLLYIDRPLTDTATALIPTGSETRFLSRNRLQTDWRLWNAQIRDDRPDLVVGTQNYLPHGSPMPAVLVLHDAMGIKKYEWDRHTPRTLKERFINRYWHYQTLASVRKSRRIITVSQGARSEILSVLTDIPQSQVTVVHNGVALPAPQYTGPRDANTVLCIASPDRRKNLSLLYDALANHRPRFGTKSLTLRVIGTSDVMTRRTKAMLERYNLSAQLLTGLDDQALSNEYARAGVFVWPSHQEGFGLPPLEMMRTGGAVVSSNAPCMPEILGEVPRYFSPDSAVGIADATRPFLEDTELCRQRGEMGRDHAATFTCRRMADETVAVWEKAARET
ncbi:MAG: glycosyltransferase family 4 protein [Akkermansiaceae bacterium]|nr:glycosyltransferase family 4 protein [Armatimonadota bacterium]